MRALLTLLCALSLSSTAAASWQPVGPWGGAAEVIRTSPGDKDLVLAATRTGALFISNTAGDSWREVPFPARATGVLHALEIDPRSGATWYVGLEGHTGRTSGVYRTTDAGRTWTLLDDTRGIAVWSIAISPSAPDVVAAGTDSGVYRSDDRGERWVRMSPAGHRELRPVVSLAFDPRASRILFAGTTRLPWKTEDGGSTWRAISTGMLDDSDVFSIVVDPSRPGRVLASACSGAYSSQNDGARWTRLATGQGAFRVHVVAIDPHAPDRVFAGTSAGLMRSADAGATWRRVSPHQVKSIAFDRFVPGRVFMAATDAGLLRSDDGGVTVRGVNAGFSSHTFSEMVPRGDALVLIGPQARYRTDGLARQWVLLGTSSAAGTRTASQPGLPPGARVTAASGSTIAATTLSAGHLSENDGASWRPCAIPAPGVSWYGLAIDPATPALVLAATSRGLFRSTDGCRSWSLVNDGLEQATAGAVLFHPARGGEAFVAQGGRVFRSTDGGSTWTPLGGDTRDLWPSQLTMLRSAPHRLFALVPGRGVFALEF